MVAHAAELSGWDFSIYSRKRKSPLYGAQYLYKPIPSLNCSDPKLVSYELHGTPEAYVKKVYGDNWDHLPDINYYNVKHEAWDIREAYDRLWLLYSGEIEHCDIPNYNSSDVIFYPIPWRFCDLVISTVPRTIWAQPGDIFESVPIWALGDTETRRVMDRPPEFHVIDNSHIYPSWHRVSNIFNYCTMEWPCDRSPYGDTFTDLAPVSGASVVLKPNYCKCSGAKDFIHLGRYGAWQKGIRSADAFYSAMEIFAKDKIDA